MYVLVFWDHTCSMLSKSVELIFEFVQKGNNGAISRS
jgi:hypothetical protein